MLTPYVLQDGDGQFMANAQLAGALRSTTCCSATPRRRFVIILNFGRPGSPMAAWGTPGGGPLTTQQVDNVIIYLRTLQVQSLNPVDIALEGPAMIRTTRAAWPSCKRQPTSSPQSVRAEVDRSIADERVLVDR